MVEVDLCPTAFPPCVGYRYCRILLSVTGRYTVPRCLPYTMYTCLPYRTYGTVLYVQ